MFSTTTTTTTTRRVRFPHKIGKFALVLGALFSGDFFVNVVESTGNTNTKKSKNNDGTTSSVSDDIVCNICEGGLRNAGDSVSQSCCQAFWEWCLNKKFSDNFLKLIGAWIGCSHAVWENWSEAAIVLGASDKNLGNGQEQILFMKRIFLLGLFIEECYECCCTFNFCTDSVCEPDKESDTFATVCHWTWARCCWSFWNALCVGTVCECGWKIMVAQISADNQDYAVNIAIAKKIFSRSLAKGCSPLKCLSCGNCTGNSLYQWIGCKSCLDLTVGKMQKRVKKQ